MNPWKMILKEKGVVDNSFSSGVYFLINQGNVYERRVIRWIKTFYKKIDPDFLIDEFDAHEMNAEFAKIDREFNVGLLDFFYGKKTHYDAEGFAKYLDSRITKISSFKPEKSDLEILLKTQHMVFQGWIFADDLKLRGRFDILVRGTVFNRMFPMYKTDKDFVVIEVKWKTIATKKDRSASMSIKQKKHVMQLYTYLRSLHAQFPQYTFEGYLMGMVKTRMSNPSNWPFARVDYPSKQLESTLVQSEKDYRWIKRFGSTLDLNNLPQYRFYPNVKSDNHPLTMKFAWKLKDWSLVPGLSQTQRAYLHNKGIGSWSDKFADVPALMDALDAKNQTKTIFNASRWIGLQYSKKPYILNSTPIFNSFTSSFNPFTTEERIAFIDFEYISSLCIEMRSKKLKRTKPYDTFWIGLLYDDNNSRQIKATRVTADSKNETRILGKGTSIKKSVAIRHYYVERLRFEDQKAMFQRFFNKLRSQGIKWIVHYSAAEMLAFESNIDRGVISNEDISDFCFFDLLGYMKSKNVMFKNAHNLSLKTLAKVLPDLGVSYDDNDIVLTWMKQYSTSKIYPVQKMMEYNTNDVYILHNLFHKIKGMILSNESGVTETKKTDMCHTPNISKIKKTD